MSDAKTIRQSRKSLREISEKTGKSVSAISAHLTSGYALGKPTSVLPKEQSALTAKVDEAQMRACLPRCETCRHWQPPSNPVDLGHCEALAWPGGTVNTFIENRPPGFRFGCSRHFGCTLHKPRTEAK